jgi:hypothetical protein
LIISGEEIVTQYPVYNLLYNNCQNFVQHLAQGVVNNAVHDQTYAEAEGYTPNEKSLNFAIRKIPLSGETI